MSCGETRPGVRNHADKHRAVLISFFSQVYFETTFDFTSFGALSDPVSLTNFMAVALRRARIIKTVRIVRTASFM